MSYTPILVIAGVSACYFSTTTISTTSLRNYKREAENLTNNILLVFVTCWTLYIICPTYGPLFTLDSAASTVSSSSSSSSVSQGVHQFGNRFASTGTACPSSHCAVATSLCISILSIKHISPVIKLFIFLWTVLIYISVVVCGMHYVLDVMIGIMVALLCYVLFGKDYGKVS